jgi:uncharacterized protein YdeI (YjbR/CyaY-like superfamily)
MTITETAPDGRLRVHAETRHDWRAWLEANHERREGVWLVSWRTAAGPDRLRMSYEEMILEALCFGWVDSTASTLDERRALLWMSPRRKGSAWSRPNKERVVRLEAAGLMRDPGRRAIEAAKADGSWTILDSVEDGIVPDDLAAAFAANPGAQEHWETFRRSSRKQLLGWIAQAKRPETRAARVAETATAAARGELGGPLRPKDGG